MSLPVLHVDRPVPDLNQWTEGRLEVKGPADAALAGAWAALVGGVRWDADRFDLAPNLRILARTGIGFDAVDLQEATRRNVMVTNTPTGPTVSTAEHAIALLFSSAKTLPAHQARLRDGTGGYAAASTATELDGLRLGLVGFGRISRRVAAIASAVGMEVLAYDPYLQSHETQVEVGLGSVELVGLDELLARADAISLHAPLTDETARLFDADRFAACKKGVIFVNTARGGLVDHDALLEALDSGHVASAGLDVTDPEPLDPGHRLLSMPNVIVTPHIASSTVAGRNRMLRLAIEQVLQALDGKRPSELLNPDVT